MPEPLDRVRERHAAALRPQSNRPAPLEMSRQNFAMHLQIVSFEQHTGTGF